ncbi:MAG: excisionase family DNA-binding protein [Sporichthyaceae bacterium]
MSSTLLTVEEAAERLNTKTRFIRRLIAERRIAFTRLGRHVRIASADLDEFVSRGRVEPTRPTQRHVVRPPQHTRS